MSTQQAKSLAEKSAELLRVIAAIGILALIAWFDEGSPTTPAVGTPSVSIASPQ